MQKRGQIRRFDRERGFGFIRPDREHEDIFFHISSVADDEAKQRIGEGAIVRFDVEASEKGPRAVKLSIEKPPRISAKKFFLVGGLLFALFAFALILHYTVFNLLVSYLLAINLVTFALTGYDKGAAGTTALRVPEFVLHVLSVLGGSIGLMFGMGVFRHKTRKGSFKYALLATLALQLFVIRLCSGYFAAYFRH